MKVTFEGTFNEIQAEIQTFVKRVYPQYELSTVVSPVDDDPSTIPLTGDMPDDPVAVEAVGSRRRGTITEKAKSKNGRRKTITKPLKSKAIDKITDADVMKAASDAASKITPDLVQEVVDEFGIGNLAQLEQEQRQEFLDKLENKVKEVNS